MLRLPRIISIVVVLIVIVLNNGIIVKSESPPYCGYSSKISTCPSDLDFPIGIIHPFWIENRTTDEYGDCISYKGFQIKCAANGRPVINLSNHLYYVLSIDNDKFITVVDVDIDAQDCPQQRRNFSINSAPFLRYNDATVNMTYFYNCSRHPQNVVQHVPCLDTYYSNSTGGRSFAFADQEISSHQFDWYQNCEEAVVVPVMSYNYGSDSTDTNYTEALKSGFVLNWDKYLVNCGNCELSGGKCWANETNHPITTSPVHCNCTDGTSQVDDICPGLYYDSNHGIDNRRISLIKVGGISKRLKLIIGGSVGAGGVLLVLILVIYRKYCYSLYNSIAPLLYNSIASLYNSIASSCRRIIKGPTKAEVFIESYGVLSLQSYKYLDIKKMTNSFKDTLGQGGYGCVFKGKLHNGQLVAVKILNESKGKGDDFINEVAAIGRTNHVNVVSLLGFCTENHKQALVYEFMSNGSLEKFIYSGKESSPTSPLLGLEKLYQITLGIARGLEYLHRGCNTRILHLDIKPHNILLDQDFCPKISDFGLAKLCPTKESIVSMVGACGTIGYIAPEVYCGNFGGVSHKSDVYSYGMMVLEMIGGRKNIDVAVEKTSEIYFPQWIYKRLRGNIKVEGSENNEAGISGGVFEEETAQKMIRVALWCIQAHPGDRPSMTKVVDMLEGNIEEVQLPPNPFPDPSSKPFPSSSY